MQSRLLVAIVVGAMASFSGPVHGQAAGESELAVLRLKLVSELDSVVTDGEIGIKGERHASIMRTDSLGRARFDGLKAGLYRATIRRVGFSPSTVDFRIEPGDNALTIHLQRSAAALDEVRIIGNRPTIARLDEFEMRRLRGDASSTITRGEIERRHPVAISQMLRGLSGIRIADSLGSIIAQSERGMKSAPNPRGRGFGMVPCTLRVAVDGVVLPALSNIDGVVPNDIYGVEVFNGPSRLPPQLAGLRTDNWCGLVAIWTRER